MNKLTALTAVATLAAGLVFSAQTFAGEGLEVANFQCYGARFARTELPFDPRAVLLTDKFNDPEQTNKSVRNVKLLCTPVGKDGNAIINPESHLVCYLVKPKHEIGLDVLVTNEFGEQRLRIRKSSYLCMSSTMQIIEKKEK